MFLMMDPNIRYCLDEFAEDLWIKRRLELSQVINSISKAGSSSAPEWIRFIHFLELECSGRYFGNDRQWSELLNLMQISKKLNHRSVKFKDIVRNKQLIEANEKVIRRLNESAKLLQTIDSSLDQLESILDNECILVLQQEPLKQHDELATTKKFLDDRCRSILYTLQIELKADMPASSGAKAQLSCARVERLQSVIVELGEFIDNMRMLYHHVSELGPLINVDQEANIENSGLDQLEHSIGSCKRIFAGIQEFRNKLTAYLLDAAAGAGRKKTNPPKRVELHLMKLINSNGQLIRGDLLVSGLKEAFVQLDKCRATLDSVMHSLRLEFGRFYFVSDLDLLTMIALDSRLVTDRSSALTRRLLGKLFNNSIESLVLNDSRQQVIGVQSPYHETILFAPEEVGTVLIKKNVNLYSVEIVRILNETLRKLRKSLQFELSKSLANNEGDLIDWSLPVQLMNLAEQIKFCQKVENGPLDKVRKFYGDLFRTLSCLRPEEIDRIDPVNRKLGEFKLSTAISMTVHFLSILGSLKEGAASGLQDWSWIKLLRYYKKPNGGIEVRIADTCFDYKFDYLAPQANDLTKGPQAGGFKRLINTRITERCTLAASQSIGNFRLGSSPFGPAGSGKTETIKALGLALGCQVILHNCDESNDGQSLDQLIWGLAHTGLWGCFDEFNRLSASALSSISATLELVQASIREARRMVELADGRIMPVDETTAFFVTLNPADANKGYRGRRRLPANLRQLFLPIAMTRVQIDAIVAESLLAMGAELGGRYFLSSDQAKVLGGRLAAFMDQLAHEITTQRSSSTCSWDLRLVMSILRRLKLLASVEKGCEQESLSLEVLLVQSLDYEIKPRLTEIDLQAFYGLLSKNFLSVDLTVRSAGNSIVGADKIFQEQLEQASSRLALNPEDAAIAEQRATQLKRLLDTRAGVILLGPSGSGKSTSWRLLQSVLSNSVGWLPVNPRACTRKTLFGSVEETTRKWVDGLLTARVRQALSMLADTTLSQIWLVLDGPIDPDWIESFNSVLDDNQILTLSSGERLSFSPTLNKSIKLIIESDSIEFASPATISRLGLVLHEPPKLVRPLPHCITVETPSSWQRQLEEARNFLDESKKSLLVVMSSDTVQSQVLRSKFISEFMLNSSSRDKIIEFNCSSLSTCSHLLELMSDSVEPDWFMINNVHLIDKEDQWASKSFIELLRFTVTYGGFYDKRQFVFRKLKSKFVITVNSVDNVDPRTLAQGCLLQLKAINGPHKISNPDVEVIGTQNIVNFLETGFFINKSPIITLSSSVHGSGRRASLIKQFHDQTILTFRNSKEALRSIEALAELLNKCRRVDSKVAIFLLSDLECRLMNPELRSNLFYQLNRLKRAPQIAKFVYLSHGLDGGEKKSHETTFWRSLGPVVHFCAKDASFQLREDLHKLIKSELGDSNESNWLIEKVANLFESQHVKDTIAENGQLVDSFVLTTIRLFKNSHTELECQRRTFTNGLNRLEEFELELAKIKLQCHKEEAELNTKKADIGQLMVSIDKTLKDSKVQREELNDLKEQQISKQNEIDSRSKQLNLELLEVSKLVEKSKAEVGQFLKPEALNEIKALRSPPTTIKDILDVLFTLLRIEDCSWTSMRSHLTKCSLKDELTNYDFQKNLDEELISKASTMMATKKDSFSVHQAARASKAVVPILGWIKATIEYGRVLIRLEPLKEEMQQLKMEASELSEMARELETKSWELNEKIKNDSSQLGKLEQDHEESLRVATSIKAQLSKAQLARDNLEGQINRWRQRLTWIKCSLEGWILVGHCAVVAALILFYQHHKDYNNNDVDDPLEEWMKLFELGAGSSRAEFCTKVLSLLLANSAERILFKPEEANRVLQLTCMRLALDLAGSTGLPPLFMDLSLTKGGAGMAQEETVQYLAFKSLLCQQQSSVAIIKCDQLNDWIQSIELALRLNKLVMVELNTDDASLDLDIMDYVFTKCQQSTLLLASNGATGNNNNKLVLVGNMDKHAAIRSLVRPVSLLTGCSSTDEIQASVMDHLLELAEPELSDATRELEHELQCKQQESQQRELRLLSRLAATSVGGCASRGQVGRGPLLHEDLVRVLSELHQLSGSLDMAYKRMNCKRAEMSSKQELYKSFARQAAQFYIDHLANLGQQNKFYHLSLETYLRLLVSDSNKQKLPDACLNNNLSTHINYKRLVRSITRPMRPAFRLEFELRLQQDKQQVSGDVVFVDDHSNGTILANDSVCCQQNDQQIGDLSLRGAVMELLHDITSLQGAPGLMVVLHEPTKSSPQLELDELFRQLMQTGDISCTYTKFYASSDSYARLESALESVVASDIPPQATDLENSKRGGGAREIIRCFCIANAHLAAKWLNSRLLQVLNQASPDNRVLIILIGESCTDTDIELDSSLLDFAQVKYWHDDSMLEFTSRLNLLTRSMLSDQMVGSQLKLERATSNSATKEQLLELVQQLVLFHVVCQEGAKGTSKKLSSCEKDKLGPSSVDSGFWRHNYSFDYDQLCLAVKLLGKLQQVVRDKQKSAHNLDHRLREQYCHYLADFVYGARMETLEDELTLNRLIKLFLGSRESGRSQMNRAKRLEATLNAGNKIEYEQQLRDLVGGFQGR